MAVLLGPFVPLITSYELLAKRTHPSPPRQLEASSRPFDAPKAPRHRSEIGPEPKSPSRNIRTNEEVNNIPTVTQLTADISFPDDTDNDSDEDDRIDRAPVAEDTDDGTADASLPPPTPRDPIETIIVQFLVGFTAGIASSVLPLGRPMCMAHSLEQTFQFGPLPSTQKTAGFCARVDGIIPSVQPGSYPVAVFEAKRDKRKKNDVAVRAQQNMEHVAVIWERHKGDKVNNPH